MTETDPAVNTHIPFNLSIRDITPEDITLSWDVEREIKFTEGTYYKLYIAPSIDAAFEPAIICNSVEQKIAIRSYYIWFAVSSVYLGEESPLSPRFKVKIKADDIYKPNKITVAEDLNGNAVPLTVGANKGLYVNLVGSAIDMGGGDDVDLIPIEDKLEDVRKLSETINTNLDASLKELEKITASVEKDHSNTHRYSAEFVSPPANPDGSIDPISAEVIHNSEYFTLNRVIVRKLSGSATGYTILAYNDCGTSEMGEATHDASKMFRAVFTPDDGTGDLRVDENINCICYVDSTLKKLHWNLIPDSGDDNRFELTYIVTDIK